MNRNGVYHELEKQKSQHKQQANKMETKPIYILQMDLPSCKAGTPFTLNEEIQWYSSPDEFETSFPAKFVEDNSTWFLPKKEEKITVSNFTREVGGSNIANNVFYKFQASGNIEYKSYQKIISAIESVINGEEEETEQQKWLNTWRDVKYQFTIEDMKNCFVQSRLTNPLVGFKHDNFESVLNEMADQKLKNEKQRD